MNGDGHHSDLTLAETLPAAAPADTYIDTVDAERFAGLIDVALDIAERRAALLDELDRAYRAGDRERVFAVAGLILGVPPGP